MVVRYGKVPQIYNISTVVPVQFYVCFETFFDIVFYLLAFFSFFFYIKKFDEEEMQYRTVPYYRKQILFKPKRI